MTIEAEQHLIACTLVDQTCVADLLEIPEVWFSRNEHKLIIRAIQDLASQSLSSDVFALSDYLEKKGQLDNCGGLSYLIEMSDSVPNLDYWKSYKRVLFDSYKLSQIKIISDTLQGQINAKQKPEDIVEQLQKGVVDLMTEHHTGGFQSLSKFMDQSIEDITWRTDNPGQSRGHTTGFTQLDQTLDGFQAGKIYVVAGRTSMGKTQYALNLCLRLAQERPVCVFSLEMTGASLSMRAICNESKVFNSKFRSGKLSDQDMNSLAAAVTRLHKNSKLFIDETPGLSVAQMRARLKAFKIQHGEIGAICVDHIGLIKKNPRKSETEAMTEIAHELAMLSKEFDAPLIEVVQINRGAEQNTNRRPMMSNLKQSGAIEEDARVVMLLYRDEYYNEDTTDKNITEVNITKNSDGETKTLFYRHNMAISHYEELTSYEQPEKISPKF